MRFSILNCAGMGVRWMIRKIPQKIILFYIPLAALVVFVLIPFLWAVSTSLKRPSDVFELPIRYLPSPATLENFITAWERNKFYIYFGNSLFIAVIAVVFVLALSVFNGYALSRFKFRGKNAFMIILLCTQLMPVIIFIIPLFLIFKNIGLINTPYSIILFYIVSQTPFNTLLMRGFISGVPKEIDEAAMVDGATRFRIIFTLIPPVILPGIVATSAFAFIGCWNEFTVAFSFITSGTKYTIPVALKMLLAESSVELTVLAAQSIIALLPPLLLFAYIQKYLVAGLSEGAVKG